MEREKVAAPDFEYAVEIMRPERERITGVFRLWEESPVNSAKVRLQFLTPLYDLTADADDYFLALNSVRDALEKGGWRIRCNGCRLNVYPSRMSQQMSGRLSAYRMTMGHPAMSADLVPVFAYDAALVPVSRREQESFYKRWLHSVEKKSVRP